MPRVVAVLRSALAATRSRRADPPPPPLSSHHRVGARAPGCSWPTRAPSRSSCCWASGGFGLIGEREG
eukprot:5894960-Alexandrium_andersonii.AAC.1